VTTETTAEAGPDLPGRKIDGRLAGSQDSDSRSSGGQEIEGRRTLAVASGAHALHDGYTDLLYVLLPLWQAEFGLGYAEIGMLRALYAGTMAGFQVPAGLVAERLGGPLILALGTALAALGYLIASVGVTGSGAGFAILAGALVLGGLGSSTQHPIASGLVAQAFSGARSRVALGTYNFAGDVGKMMLPAATAWAVVVLPWRSASLALGIFGLAGAAAILLLLRNRKLPQTGATKAASPPPAALRSAPAVAPPRGAFGVLMAIGVIDSATRMGFLTFLPFLLTMKGAGLPTIGLALTLVFAGGAAGKLACGFLGARLGVLPTVLLTEGLTAAGILLLLPLPLEAGLVLLPVVGIALNGTSSVLYGTVPEFVTPECRTRAFGIFYTGTIGAGALSPIVYGWASDAIGVVPMMGIVAGIVLATLPLVWLLRPALDRIDRV
jgi:MFS transporter, FSR family, fosmidomycin resistance protein